MPRASIVRTAVGALCALLLVAFPVPATEPAEPAASSVDARSDSGTTRPAPKKPSVAAASTPVAEGPPVALSEQHVARGPSKPVVVAKKNAVGKSTPPRLFGTVEFRGALGKLPKWTAVLKKMRAWKGYFKSADMDGLPSKGAWIKLKASVRDKSAMERLKAVNRFFNKWPYRLDMANYGVPDYWASPPEFLRKSGDCEDYAIAKFYALKELGFSADRMRIVAVRDRIRNVGHAILAVYLPDDIYILDNQTVMVLPHARYKHYVPQYSVNEKYRWMHVPVSTPTLFRRASKQ